MAFGGETLAVYRGELFVTKSLTYPADMLDEKGQPLYPRPRIRSNFSARGILNVNVGEVNDRG